MSVFAISRTRDEIDIAESSVRRMAAQVDHVILGDNSTDGTNEVFQRLREELPVTLHWDDRPNWHQPDVVRGFVMEALELGADWIVPFDLDEVWQADGRVADALMELPEDVMIAPAGLLSHVVTAQDDPSESDPLVSMGWRETEPIPLPKVAFRPREDVVTHDGNHLVSYEGVRHPAEAAGVLSVRHFPFRSPEQFVKRVEIAWPQIRDSGLDESYGTHVWAYGRTLDQGGPEALHRWFRDAFFHENPAEEPGLIFDPLEPCLP